MPASAACRVLHSKAKQNMGTGTMPRCPSNNNNNNSNNNNYYYFIFAVLYFFVIGLVGLCRKPPPLVSLSLSLSMLFI